MLLLDLKRLMTIKRNLRNYWNQCKCCSVVYTSQCLTLVLHLISTLTNGLLKVIMLFWSLGMSIGWFPDSWIIYNQNKLCSKMLQQLLSRECYCFHCPNIVIVVNQSLKMELVLNKEFILIWLIIISSSIQPINRPD